MKLFFFSVPYLREKATWNCLLSFGKKMAAVYNTCFRASMDVFCELFIYIDTSIIVLGLANHKNYYH